MKSQGTKETQGINGDAAALQRKLDAMIAVAPAGAAAVCPYPRHRGSDWRLTAEHPVRCGVCNPPANGLEVERVTVESVS